MDFIFYFQTLIILNIHFYPSSELFMLSYISSIKFKFPNPTHDWASQQQTGRLEKEKHCNALYCTGFTCASFHWLVLLGLIKGSVDNFLWAQEPDAPDIDKMGHFLSHKLTLLARETNKEEAKNSIIWYCIIHWALSLSLSFITSNMNS